MTSKEIKMLMLQKDVKQVKIARDLKVTPAAVCNVIKGTSESCRIKRAIASALSTTVHELWPENDKRAA